ncbi:FtsK/SpoIIIE domain-containing protein [Actinokineospora sp. NBRC 105648]|uniref:FtsK/SpoIIIE domain-containing protein n=1 Tax=Actinokineospora sp. NBRC 105648 TaxID=3032206 RepID=UPI0024A29A70|nr:FtsK/SpoIIIE domain-containing protein [Actinokineospora sp. NBRC 105648]GLZ39682.1 hypothetical protein Acsp05_33060 [Actinokineospora sp. NBRC 105648]
MNGPSEPVNAPVNGGVVNAPVNALEPKVFDGELVTEDDNGALPDDTGTPTRQRPTRRPDSVVRVLVDIARGIGGRVRRSEVVVRVRSVAAYRARKAPADLARLAWFVVRGTGRWAVKAWSWATYADLRADARAARSAGDTDARRTAQELIRADARARWARVGTAARRVVLAARVAGVLAGVLWLVDTVMDRADMWPWLAGVYAALGAIGAVLVAAWSVVWAVLPLLWVVAAAFEGRDREPGAGWLIQPDRDDADAWIDERMISRALAHLGITPLNAFFKGGGELIYTVPARKDGDGTFAQVRLPLGVTADMVAGQRGKLAANLGRSGLETWATKGDEDGVLDLWVADKGTLSGGAGPWPLLEDSGPDGGRVDVFAGVPFGLSQRGAIINAPLIGANWLVGGRPGQGKSAALRTLMLGAALDPTAELWAFVMGESPDFDPFAPRLSRYRMGMDDTVAEAATDALADLVTEMEKRGKTLGAQPGRPPKVSRRLADQRHLGLHPLICAIDECHELFGHPRYGKRAAELAVRVIKRGRKYGVILLLATQSPTKDSLPKEITRNIGCGVAFSVADHVANDGLLGSGRYAAGIRATELRIGTDRGTCVAVGVTDSTFDLIRTFYIPFEDGADEVTPVIQRAQRLIEDDGRALPAPDHPQLESAPPDHLTAIAEALHGERRVRTQVILARLATTNPDTYEHWTFTDLRDELARHGITARKSDGLKVLRAEDLTAALHHRDHPTDHEDHDRDPTGTQGPLPTPSLPPSPRPDQPQHPTGTTGTHQTDHPEQPRNHHQQGNDGDSLPDVNGGGHHDR